ncbi:cytochrome P450 2J6-like [Paramacrobiotus metropolitanus]|uniref:cytochrome P450 2J6-like n=1 Tax=Paramacrobiotus metropolitanus TaxID=2943436 RepID=UPI002445EEDE|nr:cytochrome P450 2J6-like [Paramacrobiotus metropolitanus]
MVSILDIAITLLFLILGQFVYDIYKRKRLQFPPGPIGLPIIGSLASFGSYPHLVFDYWRKKYASDTICYRLGFRNIVVLHNFDTIKKTLNDDASTGREHITFGTTDLQTNNGIRYGLLASEGELWQEHRRFAMSTLKHFGMGKTWLEDAIIAETDDLCKLFHKHQGRPLNPAEPIYHCVSNMMCSLAFGKRFDYSDKNFTNLAVSIADQVVQTTDDLLFSMCPYLKYIPGRFRNRYKKGQENYKRVVAFTQDIAKEHNKSVAEDEAHDYIDAFTAKANSSQNGSKGFYNEKQLEVMLYDLFAAGTETTSTTNLWCLVFMLEYPDIMAKVQEEIDHHVGNQRPVRFSDKAVLPFTEATVLEMQRLASIAPFGIPHVTQKDMYIDGYFVPENSILLPNLYSVQRDPKYWDKPDTFDPTRFLSQNGTVDKPETFSVFGIGKRACMGELLARMEVFIIIANIVQRFNLTLPPGCTISHKDYMVSIVLHPKPFDVIFTPRTEYSDMLNKSDYQCL